MGEQSEKIKKNICMGLLAHVDAGKTTLFRSTFIFKRQDTKLEEWITRMHIWIPLPLSASGESRFFQAGSAGIPGNKSYHSGYAWACGFFCRDGTYLAGPGLCSAFD